MSLDERLREIEQVLELNHKEKDYLIKEHLFLSIIFLISATFGVLLLFIGELHK